MPKKTDPAAALANARPMPKSPDHPDAAIFALAKQCAAAAKALDEASRALEQAEGRCRHLATPPKAEEAREGFQSGLTEAKRDLCKANDDYDDLAERLANMPAATMDGAFAKARVMRRAFMDDDKDLGEQFLDNLRDHMRRLGSDDAAFAMSLARDLIQLAEIAGA